MYGEDIFALSQDRPLLTPELHEANDFYGDAFVVKRYAGLPERYSTKLTISHGPEAPGDYWAHDLNAKLPGHCVCSEAARQAMEAMRPDKKFFALGPLIAYARLLWQPKQAAALKSRLNKSLLCFLPHSTHHIAASYDLDSVLDMIEREGKAFDSVTVSIYWKDCNEDLVSRLQSRGFYCVTAGHIYDKHFLDRLLSCMLPADGILSFGYTSAIIYAAYLGKLIKIVNLPVARTGPPEMFSMNPAQKVYEIIAKSFPDFSSALTPAQSDILTTLGGFDAVKTPRELRDILLDMEEMHSGHDVSWLRF